MKFETGDIFRHFHQAHSEIIVEISGETLKKCQRVILSMAEDVITLCEEEGIWYQLGGGTALGAVRHHGFIPWDDDIDINILRKDYDILLEKLEAKYGGKYSIQSISRGNFHHPYAKVRWKNSVYKTGNYDQDESGFFVDLWPLENVFDNAVLRRLHGWACMICGGLLSCRLLYSERKLDYMREAIRLNPKARNMVYLKMGAGFLISFLSVKQWAGITEAVYSLCKNNHSKYVSFPSGRKHYFTEMYLRDGMVNTVPMPFEGHQWQVARDYDAYFTAIYGPNYMIPHTEAEREYHMLMELKFPENFDFEGTGENT